MKIPKLLRRKKLRAATARRSVGASAEMDYEEISEPNMKLSRALLIVLLLHVVAVSGIIAFNAIKTRQSSFVPVAAVNPGNNPIASIPPTTNSGASNRRFAFEQKENGLREETKVSHSPLKSVAKDEHKAAKAKPTEHVKAPAHSGKTYTVVKGDNPVTIAKKLKVSYDDLLALNQIEDPRKLKIGQKLLIPKPAKAKKADE
jgi:LysM repeat protein